MTPGTSSSKDQVAMNDSSPHDQSPRAAWVCLHIHTLFPYPVNSLRQ